MKKQSNAKKTVSCRFEIKSSAKERNSFKMSEKDTKKNDLDINNKAEETVVGNEGETVGMIGEEAEGGLLRGAFRCAYRDFCGGYCFDKYNL